MSTKLHYINVGDAGTFGKTGNIHTVPNDVDVIVQALEDKEKLVIHFHGGLVKEAAGMKTALTLANRYDGAFPVSIVWETGFIETIQDRITTVHKTRLFKQLLKWVSKYTLEKLGGGIGSKGLGKPVTNAAIEDELHKETPFANVDLQVDGARGAGGLPPEEDLDFLLEELTAEFEAELDHASDLVDRLLEEPDAARLAQRGGSGTATAKGLITPKLAKDLAVIVFNVIRRHVKGTDHGFYCTVVEEICRKYYLADFGEWVWGGMKLAAKEMWQVNTGLSGEKQHVGTFFLEKLLALQERTGIVVDVVGHSAGSIAICEMFKAMHTLNLALRIRNVIFMAPAVRHDMFKAEILDHPERYSTLRMFTMADDHESRDILVPYVYTRSLLYLISGALEGGEDVPVLGMQRYLSGKKPYLDAAFLDLKTFFSAPGRMVLSDSSLLDPQASEGFRTTALKHGDFDNDDPTITSVNTLLKA